MIFRYNKSTVDSQNRLKKQDWIDVSHPGIRVQKGHLHPLTLVIREAGSIFSSLGFSIVEGPEIESEWYNFDALNIPPDHPAREMMDTFWLKSKSERLLLRTHTSPMQIRYLETHQPPLRIVVPGRCFRYEATDASHDTHFYQLEGLMLDKDISLAHFKDIIEAFFSRFFKKEIAIRLRPSYFPFVEPGFEVDISCLQCSDSSRPKRAEQSGKCSVCSGSGWVEMLGAGMVHPNVLKNAGLNPKNWQGFAFGIGLDRLAMMKYKIPDIRLFYSGDLRFINQF